MVDAKDWSSCSFEESRQTLRSWREDNVRRAEEVVEIWEHVISRKPTSLGDELWVVYEQVFMAALDCARLDVAQECIQALHHQFPKSHRVLKLEAIRLESVGKYEEALRIYDSLIKKDSSNAIYRKRKAAVYKGQGKLDDAIREINEYLTHFMNDSEAWIELSDLYLSSQDYARAAFSLEELILSNPYNHLFHQKFADIKYTQGGIDNVELARSYYGQAVRLNPNNLRALYGLFLCCQNLLTVGKLAGPKRKEYQKMATFACDLILQKYANESYSNPEVEHLAKLAESMLKSVQISTSASS